MTSTQNGATLEDCHSNFFALTDLCGIKWRRLVWDGTLGPGQAQHPPSLFGPLDDPVISSFARCLSADVLCVWRKSPNAKLGGSPLTPNDPFHTNNPPPMHQQSGGMAPNTSYMQIQQQQHHMPNMMPLPPHMNMMGPGHLPPHHMAGPSYNQAHHNHQPNNHHPHGIHPQQHQGTNLNHPPFAAPPPPTPTLNGPKELWLFWYGEDPDLSTLVNPQLLKAEADQGSWESGLSYECRTLLFKALHNLIERCLLARDFVRIGKWFIQPYDDSQRLGLKTFPSQLSCSFSFFVHGESTVCMSVDVRQHPPIRRVGKHHILSCQSPTVNMPVILAPYGLAATLTGVGYRLSDPGTHKLLEEWKHFYPVDAALKSSIYDSTPPTGPQSSPHPPNGTFGTNTNGTIGIPPVLEVIVGGVGGVRMRHPACYVLTTDMDVPKITEPRAIISPIAPKGRAMVSTDSDSTAFPSRELGTKPQVMSGPTQEVEKLKCLLPERVWQECIMCCSKGNTDSSTSNNQVGGVEMSANPGTHKDTLGHWDFTDPTKKYVCSCSTRSKRALVGKSNNSWAKGSTKTKRSLFHKRKSQQTFIVDGKSKFWDLAEEGVTQGSTPASQLVSTNASGTNKGHELSQSNLASGNSRIGGAPGTPIGGPPSKPGPGSISTGRNELPGASPASVAPSPLPVPGPLGFSGGSASIRDPMQPGQSPHAFNTEKYPTSLHGQPENNIQKSLGNQVFSPLVNCFDVPIKQECQEFPQLRENYPNPVQTCNTNGKGADTVTSRLPSRSLPPKRQLQRPVLSTKEYEPILKDEHKHQPSSVIYDHEGLDAWLHRPSKMSKMSTSTYVWGLGMNKQYDSSGFEISLSSEHRQYVKGENDPYEFDDENHQAPAVNMEGLKRKEEKIKEEARSSQYIYEKPPVLEKKADLFTIAGLEPSYSDLDQIFDNSDSSGDDEIQLQPTPPGSNKPSEHDDKGVAQQNAKHKSNLGILRPEELSKMFPTPPSHEHNPISSPCGLPESSSMELLGDSSSCLRRPLDNYSILGSPPDEPSSEVRIETPFFMKLLQPNSKQNSSDWSFVYKPPTIYKMLGSSKYAPLVLLPSQQLPPLNILPNSTYKASWQFPPTPPQSTQTPIHHPPLPLQQHSMHMGVSMPGQIHLRPGLSPISPVPNTMRGSHSLFDLGSPPPGSMYLKQGSGMQHTHGQHLASHPHMYGTRGVEANSLVVSLSLSDSVINLFRDHNFDSCTMCVCNAGNRVVGNIRGSEVGVYIPDLSPEEDPVRCNCGFSASVNRRLAHRAGLFYEDEFEITTAAASSALLNDDFYEQKKQSLLLLDPKYPNMAALLADKDAVNAANIVDSMPPYLLEMLREQCLLLFGASTASRFTGEVIHHKWTERTYNFLEYLDGNRAALTALEHGKTVMLEASGRSPYPRLPDDGLPVKAGLLYMHKWPYLWAVGPQSSQDIMQVMKALLPLLQDAVHAKAWDAQYNVSGPLTWRQFHRLAGRGTDDRCEPQPIPSVLVGLERDWVGLSPLAIKFWEKLLLEPYAYPRDVAYIVVAPDNDYILKKVRTFFRELTSMYEVCQLGRHCPISKVLRDGILRVGRNAAACLSTESVDEWFQNLPDIPTAATLRLYARVCLHYLAPQLKDITLDQTLLENPNSQSSRPIPDKPNLSPKTVPQNEPSIGTPPQGPTTPKNEFDVNDFGMKDQNGQDNNDEERDPPALVIYLVEPFGFGSDNKDLHRMASLGLLRCFASMLPVVPENIKNNITLQVISLEDIMNIGNSSLDMRFKNDQMRALSLTIYSQCRRHLVHQSGIRSLTGFGPAATTETFLKSKDMKKKESYELFSPPYVLAPVKEKVTEGVEWLGNLQSVGGMVSSGILSNGPVAPTSSSVLYIAYCISEDQRWLLATATDDRGELVDSTTISIYVPNRSKRRKASARKHGLTKLMDFILGIMSTGIQPWRLVVGRLGRVGHGELESWSTLLSRKSLLRASNQLKEACRQCSLQYPLDTPCVLSACLVSLEPDSCLRLMPDQFTPDERFGVTSTAAACTGSSTLSTPHDVSCSHILVFPTSATTQSSQTAFQEQHINCNDMGDEDLLFGETEDITDGIDGMQDLQLGDIFSSWDTGPGASSPISSPRRDSSSQAGSPGIEALGRQSPFHGTGQNRVGSRSDGSEELGNLLQQPLALGYLVSTAPAGNLPSWFWTSCPQRSSETGTGVFFKSALHIHSHSVLHNLDDLLQQQSNAKQHPLDSQYTTDVLRFVLEGYNALSWLCLDPKSHDRKSCLPVHIQKLLQLYFTISTLV